MNDTTVQTKTAATVLIIDDTPANVAVLADYLEDQGFRVVVAQDGEEGLERAVYVVPDLILLDVMMPNIDGFETCRRLKAIQTVQEIPVIFMTALTDTENVVKGFLVGGVDYVTKPIQIEEVLARINTHLAMRAMHQQLTRQNLLLQQEVEMRLQAEADLQKISDEQQVLIAKLQDAHDQLLQSEKMASIGQLAAGIAHEINNPIGFVSSNMTSLQAYFEEMFVTLENCENMIIEAGDKAQIVTRFIELKKDAEIDFLRSDFVELMKESKEGLVRVKDIVQSLKDFSHVGESNWIEADLHDGLDSTLNIVNNEIKYKADVVRQYGKLPLVACLASQLNQVFMNLLVNAAHSIKEKGIITIRTFCTGDWVSVEIEDTGSGIAPDTLKRIFEPFFTTKPVGSGTGLGLSLSYGIVNKHGGRIEVRSELGRGTCFTVHLPVKQASAGGMQ